jgi:hypothetical protein
MATGSFPGVQSGQSVMLTPHRLPVPSVMKEYSYTSTPPYGPYGLYRASVPYKVTLYLSLHLTSSVKKVLRKFVKLYVVIYFIL